MSPEVRAADPEGQGVRGGAGTRFWATSSLLRQWIRRDFRVRFTQTALGSAWAILQPLALTAGFLFLFKGVAKFETTVPYAAFVYTGMLLWALFSNGIVQSIGSMQSSLPIATRANYPRVVAPIAGSVLAVVDLAIGLTLLPIFFIVQDVDLTVRPLLIVLAILGCLTLSAGLGVFLSALSVFIRDVRLLLPFILQLGVLLTPIAYTTSDSPERLRPFLALNPVGTYVSGFRAGFLDVQAPSVQAWGLALGSSLLILAFGLWYFRAVQARFPDVA